LARSVDAATVRAKLTIHEERKLEADAPAGSRFKGYASFVVRDLAVRPHVTGLSSGMLADRGRQDGDGAAATGRRRTFRA
jgi:hypothetical protein